VRQDPGWRHGGQKNAYQGMVGKQGIIQGNTNSECDKYRLVPIGIKKIAINL